MRSAIFDFLRAAPAAPNAARAGLRAPALRRYESPWHSHKLDWDSAAWELARAMARVGDVERAQSLGRLLAAVVDAVGGGDLFEGVIEPLAAGDAWSVRLAVRAAKAAQADLAAEWAQSARQRRPDPEPGFDVEGQNPFDAGRLPAGQRTLFLMDAAVAASAKPPSARRRAEEFVAVLNAASVLMDCRHEFGASEALALVHGLLDPAGRHAAPGGMWVETSRRSGSVRCRYGRGRAALVAARFAEAPAGPDAPPGHVLRDLGPAVPGASPSPEDYDAAVADLARRRVTRAGRLGLAGGAALARAGFEGGSLPPTRSRILAVLFPRPRW